MSTADAFAALVASPELDAHLDEAALAIAAMRSDQTIGDDLTQLARAELDRLADACHEHSFSGVMATLRDAGFRGNQDAYYEPENSYLDRVLVRRTGIPITLSLVAMAIGRRIGVPIVGVGMPSHFLVGTPDGERFGDVFNGIDRLDPAACARLFEDVIAPGAAFDAAYLQPTPPVQIIRRMLNNLVVIFERMGERSHLVWGSELLTLLPDATDTDRRAHAQALANAGRFDRAAAQLDRLSGGEATDRAMAASLRARLN